jgi:feruloyl esterase
MRTIHFLFIAMLAQPAFAQQQSCESLISLGLPHTTLTSAKIIPEGPYTPPAGNGGPTAIPSALPLPAHCEVKGMIAPTKDSEIKFALWLPVNGWNGKYRQEGNGGFAGVIPYTSMVDSLRRGYATAGTDDGHESANITSASWAIGHPEKVIDFGYRAVHETSVQSKAIVRTFYNRDPSLSYFVGCSDGGREALMEAQRYPQDFNGIIAGAPANDWSHLFTSFIWNEQALLNNPASTIPLAKLPIIQNAVINACDQLDGVKDGLLENPKVCRFNPSVLMCKGTDSSECLTRPQVEALRKIYAGPKNPRTSESIFPGLPPTGTEALNGGWSAWLIGISQTQGQGAQSLFGNSYFGQMLFEESKWDFRRLNFDTDIKLNDAKDAPILNSTNPDLRLFRAEGGKLIQYHGWGDSAISPLSSIEYYENVKAFLEKYPDARSDGSRPVTDFYRLFMVPGMGHCAGGAGPYSFGNVPMSYGPTSNDPNRDIFAALEQWVEKGAVPDKIIGTGTTPADPSKPISRPLCPYPQVAKYKGSGEPYDAANFVCGK